jgi:methylenetetrahydrofolate reductase (NADPH)
VREGNLESLFKTVAELKELKPDFISVTYGAGGGTRDKTIEIASRVINEFGSEALAHLTCVAATRDDIARIVEEMKTHSIENILALRGDPPKGEKAFAAVAGGFRFASDLVACIRDTGLEFCVGGACYPEGHVETPDLDADMRHLVEKVRAGVDFLITQLFFDNQDYRAFVRRCRSAGIDVPIVPGLMPVTNVAQVHRFTQMCGARIPHELRRRLQIVAQDPAAVVATGVHWTVEQGRQLLRDGAPGLHFYTLNKSSATLAVHAALGV